MKQAVCSLSLVGVLYATLASAPAQAQSCAPLALPGPVSATGFISDHITGCTVTPGIYILDDSRYGLHAIAIAYGECQLRTAVAGVCTISGTQQRLSSGIGVWDAPVVPGGPSTSIASISPVNDKGQVTLVHEIDTRLPGTTSHPLDHMPLGPPGTKIIRFRNSITRTACDIAPSTVDHDIPVHVLSCTPKWFEDPDTHAVMRLAPVANAVATNYVYLPPDLEGVLGPALDRAMASWNVALEEGGVGQRFARTLDPCKSPTGPRCTSIGIQSIGNPRTVCAMTDVRADASTGHLTDSRLLVNLGYMSWNEASKERTFAHELGHLLGLDHPVACSSLGAGYRDSVMAPIPLDCGTPLVREHTTPTVTDTLPVKHTSYGPTPRLSCP